MIVYYDNLFDLDAAIVTLSSGVSSMPVANLLLDSLADYTRISAGTQTMTLNCGSKQKADAVALAPTYTVTLVNQKPAMTLSFSSYSLYGSDDNVTYTKICDVTTHGGKVLSEEFTEVEYQYYRFNFTGDASYYDIGKAFVGLKTVMPGQEISQKIARNYKTNKARSVTMQAYTDRRLSYWRYEVSFPDMPPDDYSDTVLPFIEACGDFKTFFVAIWGNELTTMPMIYAIMDEMDGSEFDRGEIKSGFNPSLPLTITEAF